MNIYCVSVRIQDPHFWLMPIPTDRKRITQKSHNMAIQLRDCKFSSHVCNEIYTRGISVFFLSLWEWGGGESFRNSKDDDHPFPPLWEKTLHFLTFWGRNATKPQQQQSPYLTQVLNSLWTWDKASENQNDIPLNDCSPPPVGSSLSPHQPQGICFICVRFAWHAECLAGWWDPWMGSVFPHYVTGLFISVMANRPRFLWRFQPKAWLIHSPTNAFN